MTDISSGKVPVLRVSADAWRFLQTNWQEFLPGALLLGAASAFSNAIVPTTQTIGITLIALAFSTVAGVMLSGSVYRRVLRNERIGTFGLTLGPDEFRLIGVALSLALMFVPLLMLVFFVIELVIGARIASAGIDPNQFTTDPDAFGKAVALALGPEATLALLAFVVLVAVIAIYVFVRLSLVSPATVGERRMVVFQTWRWSHGNVLPMLGAICLTVLPGLFLSVVIGSVLDRLLSPLVGQFSFVVSIVLGFVGAFLSIPGMALGATLYKGLRPADFVPK